MRYDLAIFQGATGDGQLNTLQQTLFGNGGAACTGIFALIQRWVVLFFTAKGSMRLDRTRGTSFWSAVRSGRLRTESDVFAAFLAARVEAAEQLLLDIDGLTNDEIYGGAELKSVTIRPDRTLILSVTLTSLSGTSKKITIPVTVPVYA